MTSFLYQVFQVDMVSECFWFSHVFDMWDEIMAKGK